MDPIPQDVMDGFNDANMDVYKHMWGPSEFCPTGTLKGYDRTTRLSEISVPTLFICGEHDEATPESTKAYAGHVTGATSIVIDDASHCTLLEKPQEYLKAMRDFLTQLNGS